MTVSLLHSVPADGSFSAAGAAAWDAQHVFTQATDRLLGRTTAGVGATEEITVGAGLTLSGGTLVNAGATSPIGGSDTQVQFNDGGVFAGNANFTFNKTTNQIAIAAGSTAAPTLIPTGDTNTGVWFPAADTIAASTGGTERFRILSSGNVGIGTTAPGARLQVNSEIRVADGTIILRSITFSGVSYFGNITDHPIVVQTNNVERMRILNTGNIGIGTVSPSSRLEVAGDVVNSLTNLGTGDDATVTVTNLNVGGLNRIAKVLFEIANFPIASVSGAYTAFNGSNDIGGSLILSTQTNASGGVLERMRITNAGNVGIGTTAPDALLSVNGVASFGAGTAALPSVARFGDLDTGMWFPAANTVAWSTNGIERMRLVQNGLRGIGTSNPSIDLDIRSSSSFRPQLLLYNTTADASGPYWNTRKLRGTAAANLGDNLGTFVFQSADTGGALRSAATFECLSLGAAAAYHSAYFQFNIISTAGTFIPCFQAIEGQLRTAAGTAALPGISQISDPDTGMWFPAANTLAWSTGGSERMRITSAGNLGLGTSTFGTSAATAFAIATGTAPTTGPADTIQIYSTDLSAGNTMLSLYTEGTVVNANAVAAATHRIAIRVNGTVYYLLANTAA